jgi:hypothetical protein
VDLDTILEIDTILGGPSKDEPKKEPDE